MMTRIGEEEEIPEEIIGGIQRRNLQEAGLVWVMTFDLLQQKRWRGAMISADAHTCYNRMQHAAISMCCQRLGVLMVVMICMLSTLQSMWYFLRTGHGDSSSFNGGPSPILFQGGCQGNGAAPGFWNVISLVLVLYLKNQDHAEEVVTVISQERIPCAVVMSMDNTDLPIIG